jgi:hypothetical protein
MGSGVQGKYLATTINQYESNLTKDKATFCQQSRNYVSKKDRSR